MIKLLSVLLAMGALMWVTTPPKLSEPTEALTAFDLHASTKDDMAGVIPGAEKRIRWFGTPVRTEWSVVALHGFSATRQETAPLAEMVADALRANLFETRLSGHGLEDRALEGVTAEDWLTDTAEALRVGADIGEKIVLIGTSTGATLAVAMLDQSVASAIDTLVLISPNFAPRDDAAVWLTRPMGSLIARMMLGESWSWEPNNPLQAKFWTTTYPTDSLIELMRLVDFANDKLPRQSRHRWLFFYAPDDQVVSGDAIRAAFEMIDSKEKKLIAVNDAEDPSRHVLAGDILSPGKTAGIAASIATFVQPPSAGPDSETIEHGQQ